MRQRRRERVVGGFREGADPLVHEGGAHLSEHFPRDARDDVDAERHRHATLEQLACRRPPVPHQHLDVRRDRCRAAALLDQVELFVSRVGAVDIRRVGAHQPEVVQVLDVVDVDAGQAHPDVDADADA